MGTNPLSRGNGRAAVRMLFLTPRYLGIAVSILMVMWCLSGFVMMYVSYPSLPEARRVAALAPLRLRECCTEAAAGGAIAPQTPITAVRVEMLAGHAVAEVRSASGSRVLLDLASEAPIRAVSLSEATAVAASFARRFGLPVVLSTGAPIRIDQWTTSDEFDAERPLYRFAFGDRRRSELYVSAVSGKASQFTTAPLRFWNWLGAVPHWVYFSPLRRHGFYWAQCIIFSSLIGCFLILTGIFIGVRQYLRRPAERTSPYRGYMFWHHIPGMLFGPFLLTWVASGLFSMNPWGFLEGGGAGVERARLAGALPAWQDVRSSLRHIGARPELGALVSLRSAPFDGRLFFIATTAGGDRIRLDARGESTELSREDWRQLARLLGGNGPPEHLSVEDGFYFNHHSDPIALPVYRLVLQDAERTRYYLDPVSGEILRKVDSNARGYRWLHEGLHRLDLTPSLRARPEWDVLMAVLLLGSSVVAVTGLYSAILRVTGLRRTPRA